jgi:hypothetical protein
MYNIIPVLWYYLLKRHLNGETNTAFPEDRGIRGLYHHSEWPQVADAVIEASRASALPRLCACVSKELHIWHCVCTPYVRCMPLERHMQTAWGRVSLPGGAISITEASYGQRPWAKEKDDGTRRAYTE